MSDLGLNWMILRPEPALARKSAGLKAAVVLGAIEMVSFWLRG